MEIEKLISHKYPGREVLYLVDKALGIQLPDMLALTVSESIKTLATVQTIWDWLLDHHATRRTLLVCVGGGVITDLGGFAAATYRRGIDYINVPTTLLAMVDAAVGGKTGFDYRGLKNSIGVIREPLETIILPEWLQTLPSKELLSGYAELIKTALLDNNVMDLTALLKDDLRNWEPYITQAVEVKKRIVAEDPTEQGLRKVLNLGHTIGHALEEL
ncbi:MAG: 3-dehydroquinate synthase, partial [Paludibacteraceae bacterium]|nr:3-dehydroquinate synthase [Paludibacteraceae bacterium]